MDALRVVLADDHPLFLHGLETALEREGLEIVGLAGSARELLDVVGHVEPDVVLLDVAMPGMDGVECLGELRSRFPEVKAVILSASDDEDVIERCLDAGALCFVGKSVKPEDIAHALRSVCGDLQISYRGKRAVRRNVTEGPVPAQAQLLTKREREILSILANGGSNSEIARGLWVTEQTVKFHLSNIYRKLEVSNRTQAARRGSQLGLVDLTSDSDRATDSASSGI